MADRASGEGAREIPAALVRDVELLCLDAGNTLIFLDHARIAREVVALGFETTRERLVVTEGEAKRALEAAADAADAAARSDVLVDVAWSSRSAPGARGWGIVIGTTVHRGGVPLEELPRVLDHLWREHVRWNLYSLVPEGLTAALVALRARGVRTAVISNSEGMLAGLLERLGLMPGLDRIFDSGLVGVEKPDPRIFHAALEAFGTSPDRALHLGDTYATDVVGARNAGIRAALIDPFAHYEGLHLDVARVASVAAVAEAISRA